MSEPLSRDELTQLLRESSAGDRAAFDRLVPIVYDELRAMAHNRLRAEGAGHTLNTTALVHETYLKLADQSRVEWQNRAHFFAVGARAMRRVLVDHARARNAARRGGGETPVSLDALGDGIDALMSDRAAAEVAALDDALKELTTFDARAAQVVELRFFGGLKHDEVAQALDVSESTARRLWVTARAWLKHALGDPGADLSGPSALFAGGADGH